MDYGVVKMNEWAKVGSRYKDRRSRKQKRKQNESTDSEQRERPGGSGDLESREHGKGAVAATQTGRRKRALVAFSWPGGSCANPSCTAL